MDSIKDSQRNEQDALDRALAGFFQVQTPQGFDAAWRGAVKREELKRMASSGKSRWWKAAVPAFAATVLVVGTLLTGGGDFGVTQRPPVRDEMLSGSRASKAAYDLEQSAVPEAGSGESTSSYDLMGDAAPAPIPAETAAADKGASQKKIVRTADITLATAAFDASQQAVREKVALMGGYVQSMSQYEATTWQPQRTVYFTLRIPTERLDEFLSGVSRIGRVTSRSENTQDMTVQYSDTTLRLETQQEKMKRLQELLTRAENVADLLEIETEIADTQYEIDSYETSLRSIDREVEQSLVSLTVVEETPAQSATQDGVSLGQRLADGLAASLEGTVRFFQNMLVFLVMAMPALLLLAVVGLAVWMILRRKRHGSTAYDNEEDNK